MAAQSPHVTAGIGLEHFDRPAPDVVDIVDLPSSVVQEAHRRLQHENVVMVGGASHECACTLDLVADLEAESVDKEKLGTRVIGAVKHGMAEFAWFDWTFAHDAGRAVGLAFEAAWPVVRCWLDSRPV